MVEQEDLTMHVLACFLVFVFVFFACVFRFCFVCSFVLFLGFVVVVFHFVLQGNFL